MTVETLAETRPATLALVGNPNSGKTTVFNALTGLRHKVGNYPGVTVERRVGATGLDGHHIDVIDLPGTYSLSQRAPDEDVAVSVILGRQAGEPAPDVLVNVCDASNLARNLYLTTQLLELERPMIIVLSMMDLARRRGQAPDAAGLSESLGVPVIALDGHGEDSMRLVKRTALDAAGSDAPRRRVALPDDVEGIVESLASETEGIPFGVVVKELFAEESTEETVEGGAVSESRLVAARSRLDHAHPDWWKSEAESRYRWIDAHLTTFFPRSAGDEPAATKPSRTDRLDGVLLHPVVGPLAFVGVMALVFQAVFSWASFPMDLMEVSFGVLSGSVANALGPGMLRDLLVDGVLAGVLNVFIFLPQILVLFLAIGLLEDSGYMARAAFIMDRPMRWLGLHGRSFVPMLSSFACAIPAIMSTRTIENRSARIVTILVAPLMSCSARLPVYTLVIAAFFTGRRVGFLSAGTVVILGMFLLGIVAAAVMALIFRRTLVRGEAPTLIMELPPFRWPHAGAVLRQMFERCLLFVKKVWTVILALTVILWFLQNFPRDAEIDARIETLDASVERLADDDPGRDAVVAELRAARGAVLRDSFAGRIGRFIEPVIEPLGFDWQIGIGLVASFAAREVLVSTLAQVFSVTEEDDEDFARLSRTMRRARGPDGAPLYRPLIGVSLMVFFVLACQCMSTVAVVRRETNGWRWPLFMMGYMTVLAWGASFIVFQVGSALGF